MSRYDREQRFAVIRQRECFESVQPYITMLSDVHATAIPEITITEDGGPADIKYKFSDEAQGLIDKLHALIEQESQKALTDVLTCGQGFSKTTDFPVGIKHVPYGKVYRDHDIA